MTHETGNSSVYAAQTVGWLAFIVSLTMGCLSSSPPQTRFQDLDEAEAPNDNERAEVVVASIDPPLPSAGPELRLARVEFSRSEASLLGGFIAVALTDDPGAVEILIRGLGEPDTCQDAAIGLAFLPRRMAVRPLYLALRLDCSSTIAREIAPLLDLEHLVESARRDGDLPAIDGTVSTAEDPPPSEADARCRSVAAALRAYSRESGALPSELESLARSSWEIPSETSDLCSEQVLAAATRLLNRDRAVQLAFDLSLSTPGPMPRHLIEFVNQYGLGGVTDRLADRIEESNGVICAAIVRAGNVEPAIDLLIESPVDVPRCLYPAARALRSEQGEEIDQVLESIAATISEDGCAEGALIAAIELVERGERPPSWAADVALLGRAIGAILSRRADEDQPTQAAIRHFRAAASRLHPRQDPPVEDEPVRLYQRDIRTVLDASTGQRRSALRLLLEAGTR